MRLELRPVHCERPRRERSLCCPGRCVLTLPSNFWLLDRRTLEQARAEDRKYASAEELGFIGIWSANCACPCLSAR